MLISNLTYINLDHRKDKLKHVLAVLSACPIPYFKTSGVLIENDDEYQVSEFLRSYSPNPNFLKRTLGCFFAHKNAIHNLIKIDDPNVDQYSMIVEDDVLIDEKFWNTILNTDHHAYDDADIVFFDTGRTLSNFGRYELIINQYPICYRLPKGVCASKNGTLYFSGTYCYAIKNSKLKIIKEFLDFQENVGSIDMCLMNQLNSYHVQTNLVSFNTKLNSDICNIK